ncbi:MAG: hypothetical protein CMJ64_14180 [Planctomycetaceae bacterium]|nr:hypothetical protein [Planctomycetaceae bacterium]
MRMPFSALFLFGPLVIVALPDCFSAEPFQVVEETDRITIESSTIKAAIRKKGYVSGVAGGSFIDKKTGARDLGFGLDIADWIMEPGSDEAYRDRLDDELIYRFDTPYHGKQPKRSIEGPQICTQAREVSPEIIRGEDFVAVRMSFNYKTAAPGKRTGSKWTQTIVFPEGKRYFISSDRIDAVNSSNAMFLRIDMPGHIKHENGDSFSQIYLSYLPQTNRVPGFDGKIIPAGSFRKNFAPDKWFNYRRERIEETGKSLPKRFIRAYRIRNKGTGKDGPWLAGMTLDPSIVHEAWCHQRSYVCMIEEFGGRPIKAGESFSAAFVVGYFDSIDEMHQVYDQYAGHTRLTADPTGWKLLK